MSLSPSPPFSVSQQAGRGLIKIFALSVQNITVQNSLKILPAQSGLLITQSCLSKNSPIYFLVYFGKISQLSLEYFKNSPNPIPDFETYSLEEGCLEVPLYN
jgi:hypothetical protein